MIFINQSHSKRQLLVVCVGGKNISRFCFFFLTIKKFNFPIAKSDENENDVVCLEKERNLDVRSLVLDISVNVKPEFE